MGALALAYLVSASHPNSQTEPSLAATGSRETGFFQSVMLWSGVRTAPTELPELPACPSEMRGRLGKKVNLLKYQWIGILIF